MIMAMVTFNLLAEMTNQGYSYTVTIDELGGMARLNVSMEADNKNSALPENSQGIDLLADECEALGKHLLAVSERLYREQPKKKDRK
jgi:hypothetical protein